MCVGCVGMNDISLLMNTHTHYNFQEIYESKEEAKNLFWHPQKHNFPALDAITTSVDKDSDKLTVFEFTTTDMHSINYDGAWELLTAFNIIKRTGPLTVEARLLGDTRLKYVFVVPPRIFNKLKLDQDFTTTTKKKVDHEKKKEILRKAIRQHVITCDDFKGF